MLIAAVGVLIVADYKLVVRLRRDHSRVWEAIGRPSEFFTRFEHVTNVHRYLATGEYRSLDDTQLTALGDWLRRVVRVLYVLATLLLVLLTVLKLEP
jgi:hypothetical protein